MTPEDVEKLMSESCLCNDGLCDNCNALMSAIRSLCEERDRAWTTIGRYGVPRERAKTLANGIDVLVTRMDRERASLQSRLEAAERDAAALNDIRRWLDAGATIKSSDLSKPVMTVMPAVSLRGGMTISYPDAIAQEQGKS